jgi:hypothetical protein
MIELSFEGLPPVGLVSERWTGNGTAHEGGVDTRVSETSDLAVFHSIEGELLAGDVENRRTEAARYPENGACTIDEGPGGQLQGTGVVEIQPIRQLLGTIEGRRVDRTDPGKITVEVIPDIGEGWCSAFGKRFENGCESGVVCPTGAEYARRSHSTRHEDGPGDPNGVW